MSKFLPNLTDFSTGHESWCQNWMPASMQPEYPWRKSLADARGRWGKVGKSVWRDVDADLSQEYMYPQDRVWVLRNLSKRQFVRSNRLEPPKIILEDELLPLKLRTPHSRMSFRRMSGANGQVSIGPRDRALEPLTFPQVILVLSAYPTRSTRMETDVGTSGPWVSDAFDVVTLEEHLQSATPEWKDVSIEVAADVGHLHWCSMQQAALSEPSVDGLWQRLREFGHRVPEARAKWTRWRKLTQDEDKWGSGS